MLRIARLDGMPVLLREGRAYDLRSTLPGLDNDPVLELVRHWPTVAAAIEAGALAEVPYDARRLQAPIAQPGKIVAAPANYRAHVTEMQITDTIADLGMFLKAPSSVIGPGETIELPYTDRRIDQEAELAVVIGERCRNVPIEDALDYVFGYTCLNDVTVRGKEDRSTRKSFDTFTPMGPWIVVGQDVPDPRDMRIRCWVNDELRQDCSTSQLIFDVPQLIAYTSSVMTLEPGDVIATGTPDGVGPLSDGDQVTVEIDGVGRLVNPVSAGRATQWSQTVAPLASLA